jgi:hypothetical protein
VRKLAVSGKSCSAKNAMTATMTVAMPSEKLWSVTLQDGQPNKEVTYPRE